MPIDVLVEAQLEEERMIVYRRMAVITGFIVVACVVILFASVYFAPTGNTATEWAVGGLFLGMAGLAAAVAVIGVAWLVRLTRRKASQNRRDRRTQKV